MFCHIDNISEIEILKKQNKTLLESIENVQKTLEEVDYRIKESEAKIDKLAEAEKNKIYNLEGKINHLEANEKKSEANIEELVKKVKILSESLGVETTEITIKAKDKFKCSKCDYKTNTKKGLNIHIGRKEKKKKKSKLS